MEITRLFFQNFKATKEAEFEFNKPGLSLVCGPNGAGKTTIADALSFGIRNRSVSGKRAKDLYSNLYNDKMVVEVEFNKASHRYLVRRTLLRKKSKFIPSLEIFEDGEPRKFPTSHKGNEFLAELCSTSLFFNAVFFSKSAGSFFLQLNEQQKKKFLEELLGLEVFEEAESIVKERIVELESRQSTLAREREIFVTSAGRREEELGTSVAETLQNLEAVKMKIAETDVELKSLNDWLALAEKEAAALIIMKQEDLQIREVYQNQLKKISDLEFEIEELDIGVRKTFQNTREELSKELKILLEKKDILEKDALQVEEKTRSANSVKEQELRSAGQTTLEAKSLAVQQLYAPKTTELEKQNTAILLQIQQKHSVHELKLREIRTETSEAEDILRKKFNKKTQICEREITKQFALVSKCEANTQASRIEETKLSIEIQALDKSLQDTTFTCPTCLRSGAESTILVKKAKVLKDNLQELKRTRQVEQTTLAEANTAIAEMKECITQLNTDFETALNTFRKQVTDVEEKNSKAEANEVGKLQAQVTSNVEAIDQLQKTLTTELEATRKENEAQNIESLRVLQTTTDKARQDARAVYDQNCELLNKRMTAIHSKLEESSKIESEAVLVNPARLRRTKNLAEARISQAAVLVRVEESQKTILQLELTYGKVIAAEKLKAKNVFIETKRTLEETIKSLNTRSLKLQTDFKSWEKTELTKLDKTETNLNTLSAQLAFWKDGFSSKGIRLHFISTVLPEFNRRFRKYSDELTDGNIQVKLELDDTKLKFTARNLEKQSELDMFSAGETAITSLIFLLASSEVLAVFEKFEANLAIFDEVFDTLDHLNSMLVFEALGRLAKLKSVILITHNDLLKESEIATEVYDMSV